MMIEVLRHYARPIPLLLGALLGASPLVAQVTRPQFVLSPAVQLNASPLDVQWSVIGLANQEYFVAMDFGSGPVDLLGQRFELDLSSSLTIIASGRLMTVGGVGFSRGQLPVPASTSLSGIVIYGQAVVADATSPNGSFRVSNGNSLSLYDAPSAYVESFNRPATLPLFGNVDFGHFGQVRGGAVRTRTHETIDPQGVIFESPVFGPLNPAGVRIQHAFRTQDVGATGEEELLTAIRWRPFRGQFTDFTLSDFTIRAGVTDVVPNYRVDPITALPAFPNSGLNTTFSANPRVPLTEIYRGQYRGVAGDVRADGYAPYPNLSTELVYDGVSTLLLDFATRPERGALPTIAGQQVRLMVQSSPRPNGRVVASAAPGTILDPVFVTSGSGDNTMHEYQLEFVRVKTSAEIRGWIPIGAMPDYQEPILATMEPAGTSISIEYRGADDVRGTNPTPYSTDVNLADGKPFLSYRITMVGCRTTGEVPTLYSLVVPWR